MLAHYFAVNCKPAGSWLRFVALIPAYRKSNINISGLLEQTAHCLVIIIGAICYCLASAVAAAAAAAASTSTSTSTSTPTITTTTTKTTKTTTTPVKGQVADVYCPTRKSREYL